MVLKAVVVEELLAVDRVRHRRDLTRRDLTHLSM